MRPLLATVTEAPSSNFASLVVGRQDSTQYHRYATIEPVVFPYLGTSHCRLY